MSTAVIGPNTVIQLRNALDAGEPPVTGRFIFEDAGCLAYYDSLPDKMVSEAIPQALYRSLFRHAPRDEALEIASDSGRRTAEYVMLNRIPSPVRYLLKVLPGPLSARLLLDAIEKNAWTFVGSGTCFTRFGEPSLIEISHNPLKMPGCAWHTAVFQTMFEALVSPTSLVVHDDGCSSRRDGLCRFWVSL